jgi:hypothetical protein
MLKPDIILSAFAISVFLIIYYVAVGFFPVYFQTIFGFSQATANSLGNWIWAFNAGALLVIGLVSDRLRVRKPFMVIGAVGAIVMTTIFALQTTHPSTTFTWFAVVLSLLAVFLGVAYAPWMASYTETVERRNPALAATGLAIWGLVIRIVIAISVFIVPHVVNTVTTLVEKGGTVQAIASGADPALSPAQNGVVAAAAAIDPTTAAALQANPTDQAAGAKAVQEIATALHLSPAAAQSRLVALGKAEQSDPAVQGALQYLQQNAPGVEKAAADSPKQWRNYYWIAVGGEVVFIPLIFLLTGAWSPSAARRKEEEHEAMVAKELEKLQAEKV